MRSDSISLILPLSDCKFTDTAAMARVLLRSLCVDCWIGVSDEGGRRLVRLAGRLSIAQVPDLLEACAASGALELELSDLISADAGGIEALQRVRASGATLTGVPGYIQLKLDTACEPQPPLQTRRHGPQ